VRYTRAEARKIHAHLCDAAGELHKAWEIDGSPVNYFGTLADALNKEAEDLFQQYKLGETVSV